MKIKLADGTEVEVAEDHTLAIAARELDRVKALGYASVEAYRTAMDEKLEKLDKHNKDNDEFINRQKGELGTLRKELDELAAKGGEQNNEDRNEDTVETPKEREARFAQANDSRQSALNDKERAHADAEFKKAYDMATPEDRALLMTEEGKNEFFGMVFPSSNTEQTPISLFRKQTEAPMSIGERLRKALSDDDKGRSRRPVIPNAQGSGYVAGRPQVEPVSKTVAVGRDGGVLDTLRRMEAVNK